SPMCRPAGSEASPTSSAATGQFRFAARLRECSAEAQRRSIEEAASRSRQFATAAIRRARVLENNVAGEAQGEDCRSPDSGFAQLRDNTPALPRDGSP